MVEARLNPGSYARKQLLSGSRLVAWSHRRRFEFACSAVGRGEALLDYGCGDGTFVAMVHERFGRIVGADVDVGQTADCARRMGSLGNVRFMLVRDLGGDHDGQYDVVTCMETLEHCTEAVQDVVLDDLRRRVRPGGLVLISVPIEIGPTLIAKQVARRVAGWRNLGDYKWTERYRWGELLRMTFAGWKTKIERPVHCRVRDDPTTASHGHKGFNWRTLREKVRGFMTVERTRFTPLGWTGGLLSSQCWLFCRSEAAVKSSGTR